MEHFPGLILYAYLLDRSDKIDRDCYLELKCHWFMHDPVEKKSTNEFLGVDLQTPCHRRIFRF
jgi:hypothetical protein